MTDQSVSAISPSTSNNNMSQLRTLELILKVRDAWEASSSHVDVRKQKFPAFVQWVFDTYTTEGNNDIPQAIVDLLKLFSNDQPHNYTTDYLRGKLSENRNARTYRYVLSCDGENADFRVRHFFLSFLKKREVIGLTHFLNTGWTGGARRSTQPSTTAAQNKFPAYELSAFSKLLSLAMLQRICTTLKTAPPESKKRGRKGSASAASSSSSHGNPTTVKGVPTVFRKFSASLMIRFQYAIYRVVQCWSSFVKRYGWEDIEAFARPYLLYNPDNVTIMTISTREEGFPVTVDATPDNWDNAGTLTSVEQPEFSRAFNASTREDDMHRKAVATFLKHCFDTVCSTTLYSADSAETWVTGASLRSTSSTRRAPALNSVLSQDLKDYFDNIEPSHNVTSSSSASHRAARTATQSATRQQATSAANSRRKDTTRGVPVLIQPPTSEAVAEAVSILKSFLDNKYLHCYCTGFDEAAESYDSLAGDTTELHGQVQLLLCDPPFNIRRIRRLPNSEYDRLSLADMKRLCLHALNLVRAGGHVILFCSYEQHQVWQELFRTITNDGFDEKENDEDIFDMTQALAELHGTQESDNFTVTMDPILYINKPHHYTHGARYAATHQNGTMYAFHCKRNGASLEQERAMVNWENQGYVHSSYPAVKHIIDNVPRLAPGEQVRVRMTGEYTDDDEHGDNPSASSSATSESASMPLRTEQKPKPLLQEIISRYTQPGDKVLDLFAGTFSAAIAALSLPKHRVFIGTESDKNCFDVSMLSVYYKVATYFVTAETDISIPHEVRDACDIIHRGVSLRRRDVSWEAPAGLPQYQKLSAAVVAVLASSANNPRWMLEYSGEPVHAWPLQMQVALHQADNETLLQADAAANGVMVCRSSINHPRAGRGCFAARSFEKDELIGCYYGTLVYANLIDRTRAPRKEYGQGVLMVSREDFQMYAFQVYTNRASTGFGAVTDLTDGRVSIHIVPPPFCSMRYINDARYLQGDSDRHTMTDGGARVANIVYRQAQAEVKTPKHLEKNNIIEVRALEKINTGEELFGDYGTGYALFNSDQFHDGTL